MARNQRRRSGIAAIEFALSLPVLALILLGTLEFGWYYTKLVMVNTAAYDAARVGAQADSGSQAVAMAEDAADDLLVEMGFCDGGGCDVQANREIVDGLMMVEINLQVDYDQLTGIIPSTGPLSFQAPQYLMARAVMPVVGP